MEALLAYVSTVTDSRQEKKVQHKMMDIIMIVFFSTLAHADDWVEMEVFGKEHEKFLRNYLELPNGIPSHDTIQRVFAIVPSEFLENFQKQWNEMLNSDEGDKIKRLLAIDGKTQRGNGSKAQKANHIVSAVDENYNGRNGDADGNRKENPAETGGLCTGAESKSGKSAGGCQAVFFRRRIPEKMRI